MGQPVQGMPLQQPNVNMMASGQPMVCNFHVQEISLAQMFHVAFAISDYPSSVLAAQGIPPHRKIESQEVDVQCCSWEVKGNLAVVWEIPEAALRRKIQKG